MGSKTISFCDVCSEEYNSLLTSFHLENSSIDVCDSCKDKIIKEVIQHCGTLYTNYLINGKKCPICNGKGSIKAFYGPHNDYNWEQCYQCKGNKKIQGGYTIKISKKKS